MCQHAEQRELRDADVERFGGVGCGERSDGRGNNCNGRRERQRGHAESSGDPGEQESYMPSLGPRWGLSTGARELRQASL